MKSYFLEKVRVSGVTSWTGLVSSLIALIASFTIMVEKVRLLGDPDYVTSCSVNAIFSCSPVMSSPQAAVFFGIPNPLLGIAGFSVVACIFFVSFFVRLPRFVWGLNTLGVLLALVFCFWLATQALYSINAICIYCFVVWIMTSVLFWFGLKPLLKGTRFEDWQMWVPLGLFGTVAAFLVMIFSAFTDYWLSFFS